ncbi:minor capsid protein [Streptomyces phage Spernnie]|uniref:Minor capsid protein n=1 Tax=Streptomyces phage Spernnie TaxID=2767588 RepID=A0A873WDR6_9CAUD|nr:major head protein [Streptomyces phage Spernnie]QPB09609.1 minor capsid protein [Streptomyces phage Spernnie]
MAYTPHDVIKPEKIAATAAVALEESLVVPAVFQREGIDQFKGAKGDAINIKVEGVLPYRTYGWRNDRSTELKFDTYAEKTVQVTFGDDVYSGVQLTDEQNDFDLNGWAKLMAKQTEAVGKGLEYEAVDYLLKAPYSVTLGGGVSGRSLRKTLIRAREVMNKFRIPKEGRTLLVGSGWENELLSDPDLNLAANIGDAEAVSALKEATLGRRYGFNIVTSDELPSDFAVAMVSSAFIFATGAPSVPQSVPFGAAASYNGVALRWIRDYDATRLTDRSIVNTYKGFRIVEDFLVGRDDSNPSQGFVSEHQHFVRAIKLDLDATADVLPDPDGPDAKAQELAAITGIAGAADGAGV